MACSFFTTGCLVILLCFRLSSARESHPISTSHHIKYIKNAAHDFKYVRDHMKTRELSLMSSFEEIFVSKSFRSNFATKENGISDQCYAALSSMIEDLYEAKYYALHMVDAMGKQQSGIKRGNYRWRGEYYECLDSYPPAELQFGAKWCNMILHVDPDVILGGQVGTCMPTVCSEDDISYVYQTIVDDVVNDTHPFLVYTACNEQVSGYKGVDGFALFVVIVLGLLVVGATGYEYYLLFEMGEPADANEIQKVDETNINFVLKMLLAFSLIKNTRSVFDTTQKDGNIHCLHGIRFITMTWIILGHTFLLFIPHIDNMVDMGQYYLTHGANQVVVGAEFGVDTFFFMSGLLVTFLALRQMEKNGTLNIWLMYLGRYLRLTPAYAFVILFSVSLYGHLGDGPTWPASFRAVKEPCHDYWWTNLLYINNFYPTGIFDQCVGWGWYLGNDMQFYLLAPISIFFLYNNAKMGMAILGLGLFSNVLVTGILSTVFEVQPDAIGLSQLSEYAIEVFDYANATYNGVTTTSSPTPVDAPPDNEFWADIYVKPWSRIGAYIVGIATGYFLHITKGKFDLNKWVILGTWVVVAIIQLTLVYGLWGPVEGMTIPTVSTAAFYICMSRPLWAIGIAWVVIACVAGYAGPINTFLSWKIFIPLSRLTYCTYLVHPLVIVLLCSSRENELKFDMSTLITYYLATVVLSYGVAYILAMMIEIPMISILKNIFPSDGKGDHPKTILNINYTNGEVEVGNGMPEKATKEYTISV